MKKNILNLINLILFIWLLVGCNNQNITQSDLTSIIKSYENLNIEFSDNNNFDYVTNDLTLINKDYQNDVLISWNSNKEIIVSNEGKVNRINFNIKVVLTAYLSKGEYSLSKDFELNIIKKDKTPYDHILETGIYNQLLDVTVYILFYEKLPSNYLKKSEVSGHISNYWTTNNLLCIGGDRFYNYERLLPDKTGRLYYEADINYQGENSRNAERIVHSNDGVVFYTDDHYSSFVMFDKEREIWI